MRAAKVIACLVATAVAAASARADVENGKVVYLKAVQAIARICSDMWEIKDREALNAKEKELLGNADRQIEKMELLIDELQNKLKEAKLEYKEKDTSLNLSVVQAVEEYAKTGGGEVDTKDLKSFGKSIAQGGSAAGSVAGAEVALDQVRGATTKVDEIRARLTLAVIARKLMLYAKSRFAVCAADQREYITGKKDTSGEGNGPGWAGTVAGDAKLKCEQGVPPPDKNKTWEETVRYSIRLNPPQNTSQASIGRGTFDFAGVSHKIAGFAASDGTFAASSKKDYQTIILTGKLARNGAGSLTSSGTVRVSLDSPAKLVGVWTGTLCEGTYSF